MTLETKAIEDMLAENWLTRQQASRIIGTSAEWVWKLSNNGQTDDLNTL